MLQLVILNILFHHFTHSPTHHSLTHSLTLHSQVNRLTECHSFSPGHTMFVLPKKDNENKNEEENVHEDDVLEPEKLLNSDLVVSE